MVFGVAAIDLVEDVGSAGCQSVRGRRGEAALVCVLTLRVFDSGDENLRQVRTRYNLLVIRVRGAHELAR